MYVSRFYLVEAGVLVLLLLLVPYILKALLNLWRSHKAFSKLPCDPEGSVFLFGHGPRVLEPAVGVRCYQCKFFLQVVRDPEAALEWYRTWATEKKWKCARLNFGPGFDILMTLHSDTAKVVLQKGIAVLQYL